MKVEWVYNNELMHMANHRVLCHGNAHNYLVFAMQRCHEDKWKIPKEKKTCLPGHYTLEITSHWKLCLCFLLFLWTQDPSESCEIHPVILLLLLLPSADDICVRETRSTWEQLLLHQLPALCSCLCSHQHQLPILPGFGEERLHFQLPTLMEDWEENLKVTAL